MVWTLSFSDRLDYGSLDKIAIPLVLSLNSLNRIQLRPKLDTGSSFCVFQRTQEGNW